MTETTWGSWSLGHDGTVLSHDGGYGIALGDIPTHASELIWIEHLRGKGWATDEVIEDFKRGVTAALEAGLIPHAYPGDN